jgi:hypothetical protein
LSITRHVTLPSERYEQLRSLAGQLDCSLSDAVGHLLTIASEAGLIPKVIPGLTVKRTKDGRVALDFGAGRRVLPADAAERYAKHILGTAGLLPRDAAERYRKLMAGQSLTVLPDSGLGADRRGAGVRLLDPARQVERPLAPSVAADYARQILAAARP